VKIRGIRPFRLRIPGFEFEGHQAQRVFGGGLQPRRQAAIVDGSPGGDCPGRIEHHADVETLQIARITSDVELELRRRGELGILKKVGQPAHSRSPLPGSGGLVTAQKLPVSYRRSMRNHSQEREFGTRKLGVETVQNPCVVRKKAEMCLDAIHHQRA